MITLDEAIQHALDIAEINENIVENTDYHNWMDIASCQKCAEEHRQLAEWLTELKELREQIMAYQIALDRANEKFLYLGYEEYFYDMDYGRDMLKIFMEAFVDEMREEYESK